jgi:hypothetical protein
MAIAAADAAIALTMTGLAAFLRILMLLNTPPNLDVMDTLALCLYPYYKNPNTRQLQELL